jgi:hypothetical protein
LGSFCHFVCDQSDGLRVNFMVGSVTLIPRCCLRGLTAALTIALAFYSYFEIKTDQPSLAARIVT